MRRAHLNTGIVLLSSVTTLNIERARSMKYGAAHVNYWPLFLASLRGTGTPQIPDPFLPHPYSTSTLFLSTLGTR